MAGRKTILTQDLIGRASYYVDSCKDILYEDGPKRGEVKEVILPTIEGLADHLGISKDTIYDWKKNCDEKEPDTLFWQFSDVLEKLYNRQAVKLINKGLQGIYSPVMSKMMLSKHGYIEKSDLTSDGKSIAPDPAQVAAADAAIQNFLKHGKDVATNDVQSDPGHTSGAK